MEGQIRHRLEDLAVQSMEKQMYTFSDFLSTQDAAVAFGIGEDRMRCFFGGAENCERVMVRFGDPEELGYEMPFPIRVLHVLPRSRKYSDELTHRDYLGALMNLGIERDTIGDIVIKENAAWIFVCDKIALFAAEQLVRVKHTAVDCILSDEAPEEIGPVLEEQAVTVSSVRLDGVLAKLMHLSRSRAKELFPEHRVFLNGRICENESAPLAENDVVAVRGFGKFIYRGIQKETKKGREKVLVALYR